MNFKEQAPLFKEWLIQRGISYKVARDLVSRCKRIERDLGVNLDHETSNYEQFRLLLIAIADHAPQHCQAASTATRYTSSLRAAARKYALFRHGEKALTYKYAHALAKNRLKISGCDSAKI